MTSNLRFFVFFIFIFQFALPFTARAEKTDLSKYVESVEQAETGMTVWEVIESGGWVMVILAVISLLMMALVAFLMIRIRVSTTVPEAFSEEMIKQIQAKKFAVVSTSCETQKCSVAEVFRAALSKRDKPRTALEEEVAVSAKKEMTSLWEPISYLTDIASIAPMVGLLGTVIGMIQAFNAIAFQTAVVKPILLAGGVSKAMVTTAAGMIVAIIAMIFYSYFRFRAGKINNRLEHYSNEVVTALAKD